MIGFSRSLDRLREGSHWQSLICLMMFATTQACGAVGPDDSATVDAAAADAGIDEQVDANDVDANLELACQVDDFEGVALAPHWQPDAIGTSPELAVSGSRLVITDAAFAGTAADPVRSWIDNIATDRGNQMHWNHPISTGDFTLAFDMDWASSEGELTHVSIGLVNADGRLELNAGFQDPFGGDFGEPFYRSFEGSAEGFRLLRAQSGTFRIEAERQDGELVVRRDGQEVAREPFGANIQAIAVTTVRFRDSSGQEFPFGDSSIGSISICY